MAQADRLPVSSGATEPLLQAQLFAVPQVSVDLPRLTSGRHRTLQFWLAWWR